MRQRGDRRCLEPTSLDLIMQLIKQKLLTVLISDFEQRTGSCLILKHKHGIYYQQIFFAMEICQKLGKQETENRFAVAASW